MGNPRLRVPLAALARRGSARVQKDQKVFVQLQKMLLHGENVSPRNIRED
jgi:hypothetical protein